MNVFALTLNLVCLCFSIFLIVIYFSKKNMNNIENIFFRFIIICDFFIVLFEFLFPILCYYKSDNLLLIGLSKKFAYFFIISFFTFLFNYAVIIAIENSGKSKKITKNKRKIVFLITFIVLFIVGIIEFVIPIKYEFRSDGFVSYAYGPAINDFVTVYTMILVFFLVPILLINWKKFNKKKMAPIGMVMILETIAIIVNLIDPTLCTVSLSLTLGAYVMFHTIENPDMKLINELELAKNQAEKASQAKSDFLSSMSHELRTPINAISGLSQMISITDDVEEMHQDSKDIIVASQKLLELVDSVLDINKIEANQIEVVEKNYNPLSILNSLSSKISMRIGDKPIAFNTEFSPDIPMNLYGDSEKIRIILTNLLTNAIKYTESGTVSFKVNSIIDKDRCNLEFIISDTGRGIREDQLDMLFTKFYRLEEDKDSDIEGTGLGLAITKSLVELMDGKISVNSTYGEGSTFIVTLTQKLEGIDQIVDENKDVEVL